MQSGDEFAGRYRLEDLRGRGAMSEVWRAHDERLDRTVALKLLSPTADLERFRREAHAVAALSHENVMRLFDYGEAETGPFMAFEWLDGGTLEERLGDGALPPPEVERIARGIAAGLAHLHGRGIVHRDLKPANVLFDGEGRPKLADLGIARVVADGGTLTEEGTVLGTAAYISPEQADGQPAVPASDVYSFGVILFRMLTGALPFSAADAFELIRLHRTAEPPPVEPVDPDTPPALPALAAAALQKDPAARPADGEALLSRLESIPAPAAEQTYVLSPPPPPAAAPARSRRTAALAALLVVLALGGAVLAWAVTRPDAPAAAHTGTTGAVLATRTHRHGTTAATSTYTPPTTQTHQQQETTTRTRTHKATTATTQTTVPSVSVPPPPTTQLPPPTTTTTISTTVGTTTAVTGTTTTLP